MRALARSSSSPAQPKPTMGESSSDLPMLAACPQSTPLVPLLAVHELVGDADADDGADQRMRTGGGQAEPPGAEVPDDGGDQQGEDHGESGFAADLQNQFDRQQRDDGEGYQAAGGQHAEEIPEAGPDHGDVRLERVGVDDRGHGVGGVVESVDELEAESDQQRDPEKHEGQDGFVVHEGKIVQQAGAGIGNSDDQHDAENQHADFAGRAGEFLVEYGLRCSGHGCSSGRRC